MYKISVLISGNGSTLDNLCHHCYNSEEGILHGLVEITRVVSDRECKGLQVADRWNISKMVLRPIDYMDNASWSDALFDCDVDLHIMGGFLSRVTVNKKHENRILNIHPSLLPSYGGEGMYGLKVHEAVIANNEPITGCTVHTIDNEIDKGMIIGQVKQAVLPWDDPRSLQQSVQLMERNLYPRTILNYLRYLSKQDKNDSSQA